MTVYDRHQDGAGVVASTCCIDVRPCIQQRYRYVGKSLSDSKQKWRQSALGANELGVTERSPVPFILFDFFNVYFLLRSVFPGGLYRCGNLSGIRRPGARFRTALLAKGVENFIPVCLRDKIFGVARNQEK